LATKPFLTLAGVGRTHHTAELRVVDSEAVRLILSTRNV
jgi:hypothetical protein